MFSDVARSGGFGDMFGDIRRNCYTSVSRCAVANAAAGRLQHDVRSIFPVVHVTRVHHDGRGQFPVVLVTRVYHDLRGIFLGTAAAGRRQDDVRSVFLVVPAQTMFVAYSV